MSGVTILGPEEPWYSAEGMEVARVKWQGVYTSPDDKT